MDQSVHAAEGLRLAADLASRHQSRLTALYVKELSPSQRHEQSVAELGQGSAEAITRTNRAIRHVIDESAKRLQAALAVEERERGLEVEWRCLGRYSLPPGDSYVEIGAPVLCYAADSGNSCRTVDMGYP